MAPNLPDWDPHDTVYRDQEECMLDYSGNIKRQKVNPFESKTTNTGVGFFDDLDGNSADDSQFISAVNHSVYDATSNPAYYADSLLSRLHSWTNDTSHNVSLIRHGKYKSIDPATLASNWNIPLEQAQRTMEATTQHCSRTAEVPSLQ